MFLNVSTGPGEEHPGAREERLLGDVLVQEELRAALARVRRLHQPRLQAQLQGKSSTIKITLSVVYKKQL